MKYPSNNLTDAAKSYLESISSDFAEYIVQEAERMAKVRDKASGEITEADLKYAYQIFRYKDKIANDGNIVQKMSKSIRSKRVLKFILLFSIIYVIIGLALALKERYRININDEPGLLMAFVGAIFSIISVFMLKTLDDIKDMSSKLKSYDNNDKNDERNDKRIMKLYSFIEECGIRLMPDNEDKAKKYDTETVYHFINNLFSDSSDQNKLQQIYTARNIIFYELGEIPREKKSDIIDMAYDILHKLEKLLSYSDHFIFTEAEITKKNADWSANNSEEE